MSQNIEAACELLTTVPTAGDAQLDQIAARLYMATQNWSSAAAVLSRMDKEDIAIRNQLNLARNLDQLQQHRSTVYQTLVQTAATNQHTLHRLPNGQLTIARLRINAEPLLLSTGPDPTLAAQKAINALSETLTQGRAIGLNGAGDGHVLLHLARTATTLLHNQTSAIHLFEPDTDLLMHLLMLHDYTGLEGPIQQERFEWHVGPTWQESYETAMLGSTLTLPEPACVAQISGDQQALQTLLANVQEKGKANHDAIKASVDAYYQSFTHQQFKALCSDKPPRQPRVLLVTSRFTSVLQHETRRIANAFESLGWSVHIAIEPHDHHRLLAMSLHQIIDQFKPDLLFTIDHLRHEQGSMLPANLPHCCWVQDLLPNITTAAAGQSVGDNDWVITFCTPLLTHRFNYPKSRCIDAPIMMASEPTLPTSWLNDGPDLSYVSNLSQDATQMVATTLTAATPYDQPLLRKCCDQIVNHYKTGRCLPSKTDVGSIITPILETHLQHTHSATQIHSIVLNFIDVLWNPLNIGLYRQQALAWVAQIAEEQNLTLALYGKGWENHSQFARYAQGPIHPGQPLQQLTRSTKINLNLEPYPCTTHVRLLDGLTAGGFYLVRHHPANTLLPKLAAFINQHAPNAHNDADALAMTPKEHQPELQELLLQTQGVSYDHPADVVAQMRCYQNAQVMHDQDPLLPNLDDITFDDFKSCRDRITTFIADAAKRKTVRDKQHAAVASRLTLKQGLSRIIRFMHDTTGQVVQASSNAAAKKQIHRSSTSKSNSPIAVSA